VPKFSSEIAVKCGLFPLLALARCFWGGWLAADLSEV